MRNKLPKVGIAMVLLAGVLSMCAFCSKQEVDEKEDAKQKGILLAFDDYSIYTWEDHFDLLDEYDVDVTFFITANEPSDFCEKAIERGHEIGFHTAGHAKLTELSEEEFYEQAIAPLENFQKEGIEITSFAYPYGEYEDWMIPELLKHYKTLRGAWRYVGYLKEDINGGMIEAKSIDNGAFEDDEDFRDKICKMLDDLNACGDGTVTAMFSHAIGDGDWSITPDRLEILFQEAQERDLEFYTFKELQ